MKNGTYYENVVVDKTINLIGISKKNTTIDGGGSEDVVYVTDDWVNITGFTLANSGSFGFDAGIELNHVQNCKIFNNNALNNGDGIYLSFSSNNNIMGNNVSSNDADGIRFWSSSSNYIIGNNISNYGGGIEFGTSINNFIINNNISNNVYGILLRYSSSNNDIMNNNIVSNIGEGIYVGESASNNITGNTFINDSIILGGDNLSHYNSHNIPPNNIVNGNPLYYYKDCNSVNIDGELIGQLILANCTSINVKNLQINNTDMAIEAAYTTNTTITNNDVFSNTFNGIFLYSSNRNNIISNNISDSAAGIDLRNSIENNIKDNNVSNNGVSIWLDTSNNNIIANNNCSSNNYIGIILQDLNHNTIEKNTCSSNGYDGILLQSSSNYNTIKNNTCKSNTENGICISHSSNNTVENNICNSNTQNGIYLVFSSNYNTIKNNTCNSNTLNGIYLYLFSPSINYPSNNIIAENNITSNGCGINLTSSSYNRIYHNNIINNANQAYDNRDNNYWDNGFPSGGNYWSNYNGVDLNTTPTQDVPPSDGLGDTPFVIDSDSQDNYPLIQPYMEKTFENYTILKQGWNLISIPLIQEEQSLPKVLEMIDGYYDAVRVYDSSDPADPWKHTHTGKPSGNDLTKLNETMGFWIHVTRPGDTIFLYNGTTPTTSQQIQLHKGWNLVGYPSLNSYNRTDGLNNTKFGTHINKIMWYNATTKTWHSMEEMDYFRLGTGYWFHAKEDIVWRVPS